MFKFTPVIEKAIAIAGMAHKDQYDKVGMPYILHPYNVAERCAIFYELNADTLPQKISYETLMLVALLHDVVEDTKVTLEDLKSAFGHKHGFVESMALITHSEADNREEYIYKIKNSEFLYPLIVKLMDLTENMREDRKTNDLAKQAERNKRYANEYHCLFKELLHRCPKGIRLDK